MNAPDMTRDQLIADERAAERSVVEAEAAWLLALATEEPAGIDAAATRLATARTESLATRQRMQDRLDAWTRYATYREALAHAAANGVTLPAVT